jgi:hypothetical protein
MSNALTLSDMSPALRKVVGRESHEPHRRKSRMREIRLSGSGEGLGNDLLAPPLREHPQRPTARRRAAQCGLDMLRRMEEG